MKCFTWTSTLVVLLVSLVETPAQANIFQISESLPIDSVGYTQIISVTDLDRDGNLDIVLGVGPSGNSIRIAERVSGAWVTRQTIAEGNIQRAVVGDVDGDGTPEIFSTPDRNTVRIREANGDNNYPIIYEQSYGNLLENFAIGDSNGNGAKEFLIARESNPVRVFILEGTGDDTYSDLGSVTGPNDNSFVVGTEDLDDDGLADLVFSTHSGGAPTTQLYENLVTAWSVSGFGAYALGDTDGNGDVELIGSSNFNPLFGDFRIFESNGDNSVQEVFSESSGYDSVADLDNDGQADLARIIPDATGDLNLIRVYTRVGSATVETATSGAVFQGTTGDITYIYAMGDSNGDGTPELAYLQGQTLHLVWEPAPIISSVPSNLDFGEQDIDDGATAPLLATIRNVGATDIVFTGAGISLTGADAGEFQITNSPSTAVLPQGGTREVLITFDPASLGVKSASLTITTNDPDDPTFVVLLTGIGIDPEIDVTGDPFELESPNEEVDGEFGYSVAGVSDVNGDGRGDIVIGAIREDPGASPSNAGRAYIYDGSTGALLQTLVSPNEEVDGEFGLSVSGVPDVNGDGRGDVVIGAWLEDPGASPSDAGRAYIFDGATGALLQTLVSPNEDNLGLFGHSVSGVSDVNGDGRGDVVIGAYREDPGASPSGAGSAYIYDGATGALLLTLLSPNEEIDGRFGVSVSGVSDVNGDGRGDVAIGAYFEDPGASPSDAGRAYIFDGSTGALLRTLVSPNEETSGNFGVRLSGVSDVNGDGRGDVVIGAYFEDPGASPTDAGRAYIFDGSTGALLQTLVSPNEETLGQFGTWVSGISDVNGDGRGDAVIGAYREDPGASPTDAGRAYIYDGSTGALLRILASSNEESGGWFGYGVSGVPDVDGDGLAEVVIGAREEDPGASPTGAGRVYAFSSILSLDFGSQNINGGPTAGMQVTITNTGTGDLTFTGSEVALTGADPGEFVITADSGENPLAPSGTRTVEVAFDPSSAGLKSASLTITSNDADEPTVEVSLSGTGIVPEIDVTGGPFAFGIQDIDDGATAGMQVTITNTGTADLLFTGSQVALTGTDPGEFSITADSGENPLPPSATRTVTVVFNPNSIGSKSAALTITSDDTDEPTVNVSLSGTGIDQEIDVTRGLVELESPNEEVDGDFGLSVSGVPDVNGDGRGDILIGASRESPGASPNEAGRAYIYDGSTGALLQSLASPNEEVTGNFGQSVSGVPDVNGDGRGDVVVGAYFEDPGASPSDAGRAYIFDGATGALLRTLASPNQETSGRFGGALSGVPDVNGDGRGDVVIGAYFEDPGASPSDSGRAYIFDGATGALLRTLVSPNQELGGNFGVRTSGVSDVNGDGRGDVVIGAWLEDPGASPADAGRAYIFDGSTGALLRTLVSPNQETSAQFGVSVSGVSDVNGDGREDVVIGARLEDPGASPSDAGRAYIFDGSTGALLQTLASPNEELDGQFAVSVSGVSDFNGDGRGDVVVGAWHEDPGASPSDAGRAYVFDGSTGALLQTLVSPNEESDGFFGWWVSGVSDIDGDGLGDVVIGARNEGPGASPSGAGRAYLFSSIPSPDFGSQDVDDGPTGGMLVTITNTGTADLAVTSVALSGADPGEFLILSDSGASPLAPGAKRTVRIAFDPTSIGLKSANLTIASDDSDEPTVEVSVSGTGIDQEIDVAPTFLAFGIQNINDGPTAGMVVAVTNTGNIDLMVTSVSMTGPDGADFPIAADSGENPIPPSGTRIVTVTFDPSTAGVKSASLTILSDDTDEATTIVLVTGTAVEPPPTLPDPIGNPDFALKKIPDIRHAIDPAGVPPTAILDLDEYALDTTNRDADGLALPLAWDKATTTGDDNSAVNVANELQVSVPAQGAPSSGYLILSASDGASGTAFIGPTKVKTANTLLGGPLVDEYLFLGAATSSIPYTWCVTEGEAVSIPLAQSSSGGGTLSLNVSDGVGRTCFYGPNTVLDSNEQLFPRASYNDPIVSLGSADDTLSGVSLLAGALQVNAGTDGLVITPQPGFSDWARVTLTRSFDDGSDDCYTVAIAEALQGSPSDLDGFPFTGVPSAQGLAGSEDFEGITLTDFLGVADSAAYNAISTGGDPGVGGARSLQTTAWDVRPLDPTVGNSGLAPVAITSAGKPSATFPGATSGNALKVDFTQQDGQGIIAFHKGIPPSSYSPGDVLTFSMNAYFDLNYDGANDDAINDGQNGFVFAMALGDALTLSMGNFNYMDFPPTDDAVNDPNAPVGSAHYTNKEAILHGRWTRHQVSWRVPEIGQSVTGGPNGTGDLVDPTGLGAAWTVQRGDTATPVNQTVWLDNLCVAVCPGPLSFALGAIQAPMISAGYAFEYNGTNSTFYGFFGGTDHPQPAAINRGAMINGNFSTNAGTSSVAFPAASPSNFFRAAENAAAGWIDSAVGSAAAYIGNGGPTVALGFPAGFDDALVPMSTASTVSRTKTPYLDLALIDQALNPGLRVETVSFAGGSGSGPETLNQIVNNVSGIFGVRFSVRADGPAPSANAQLNVVLSNADVNCGMVSQVGPQMLPNGADAVGAGTVWADYFLEGSVTTFHSPQNFAVAQQASHSAVTAALNADNPGAQMAQIEIIRAPYAAGLLALQNTGIGNGYEAFMGEVAPAGSLGTAAQQAAAPGASGLSNMFVDEIGFYAVRDSIHFYDEALCVTP